MRRDDANTVIQVRGLVRLVEHEDLVAREARRDLWIARVGWTLILLSIGSCWSAVIYWIARVLPW